MKTPAALVQLTKLETSISTPFIENKLNHAYYSSYRDSSHGPVREEPCWRQVVHLVCINFRVFLVVEILKTTGALAGASGAMQQEWFWDFQAPSSGRS